MHEILQKRFWFNEFQQILSKIKYNHIWLSNTELHLIRQLIEMMTRFEVQVTVTLHEQLYGMLQQITDFETIFFELVEILQLHCIKKFQKVLLLLEIFCSYQKI
jgi:hypothetical protein